MRYPLSHDPEVTRFHRLRSFAGASVLAAFALGFTVLAATAPQAPEHVSVNCHDAHTGTLSDALPEVPGCVPHESPAARREARLAPSSGRAVEPLPAPSADARADDPPVATF